MLDRKIRKFEIGKHQVFNIVYEQDNENTGGYDTMQLKCSEYPRPELIEAVKKAFTLHRRDFRITGLLRRSSNSQKACLHIQREDGRDRSYHNSKVLHT